MAYRTDILIAAAGQGRRMGAGKNKLLLELGGLPVVVRTLALFQAMGQIDRIWLVTGQDEAAQWAPHLKPFDKLQPPVAGGAERQDSVFNGLRAMAASPAGPPERVLVHDGARPFCTPRLVERVVKALDGHPGAVPVLPIHDTVRRVEEGHTQVVDRSQLFRIQTPQGFHFGPLLAAHSQAAQEGFYGTDDGQLLERQGARLALVAGEARNIKLTTPQDLPLGGWLLQNPAWGQAE